MRVAVVGSRNAQEKIKVSILRMIPADVSEIVSGGAEGVDTYAEDLADILGVPVKKFLPDYEKYGKQAPLVRNLEIIKYADEVLAFWDNHSKGTQHVIVNCIKMQKPVRIIPVPYDGDSEEEIELF